MSRSVEVASGPAHPPSPVVEGPHLAGTVHRWQIDEQSELLCRCLMPVVESLKQRGSVRRFWFDRYDARGPHLFLLVTVTPGLEDAVRRELDHALRDHLDDHPAAEDLPEGQLAERHQACIGRELCALHGEEGIAPRDSIHWGVQPGDAYPFFHLRDLPDPEDLWRQMDELCRWVGESLARSDAPMRIAVQWLKGLEGSLARLREDPLAYWEYYARSMMPRIDPSYEGLSRRMGSRNEGQLARSWNAPPEVPPWTGFDGLVRAVTEEQIPQHRSAALLREIAHMTIKQLGVFAWQERPMILYGWQRALERQLPGP